MSQFSEAVGPPLVRVVRGHPNDEELVALATGLLVLQASHVPVMTATVQRAMWDNRANILGTQPYGRTSMGWSRWAV